MVKKTLKATYKPTTNSEHGNQNTFLVSGVLFLLGLVNGKFFFVIILCTIPKAQKCSRYTFCCILKLNFCAQLFGGLIFVI